jgi:hypothetical protein
MIMTPLPLIILAHIPKIVVPQVHFLLKEITVKASMAYDDKHFKETVDAFIAGTGQSYIPVLRLY